MDEYIKREDAIKLIFEQFHMYFEVPCLPRDEAIQRQVCAVRDKINEIPAADVAPVRHGRWIFGKDLPYIWGKMPKNKYHLYCSECLEQAFNRSEDNDPDFDADTPSCPNCGAKMDGGDGNDDAE